MQEFDIDTERLPLGTLSKDQVQRGYDVLERLRSALNGSADSLERLSSEFYQVLVSTLPSNHLLVVPMKHWTASSSNWYIGRHTAIFDLLSSHAAAHMHPAHSLC